MATFEIKAPDGKTYRVKGDNEAGAIDALEQMLGQGRSNWSTGQTLNNAAYQASSGVYQGLSAVAGLPGSLSELGVSMGLPQQYGGVGGMPNPNAPTTNQSPFPTAGDVSGFVQDKLGKFATPETATDRYLQAAGRGVGGGLAFGPAGAAGGLISETAGQTAREFDAPKWVEVAASLGAPLVAGGVSSLVRNLAPGHQAQLGQALQGLTQQELRAAEGLMQRAQQSGNPLTWSEAINQTTNGRFPQLAQLQRVAEQSPGGAAQLSPIMSQRLEQSRRLAGENLDRIAPQPQGQALEQVPYRVRGAAEDVIQSERDITNTLSRPAYDATTGNPNAVLPPQAYQQLLQRYPNLPQVIQAVRADPIRYGNLEGMADDSFAVLDQAKKYLDDVASASQRQGQNYAASNAGGQSRGMVDELAAADPRYGSALNIQSMRQRYVEEPLRQGQVGQLAETPALLASQRQKLLPVGKQETVDPQSIANTVQRLEQQAPGAGRDWLRTNLQSEWDEVLKAYKTAGADESRGASLWAHLSGNEGRRANLQAYVNALDPSGQTWRGFENMLQILGAQRYRLPANSATAFNQETIAALKSKGIPVSMEDINPVSFLQGEVKQASAIRRYRINSQRLADLLLDPDAAPRLRALAQMDPRTTGARTLAGALLVTSMPDTEAQ